LLGGVGRYLDFCSGTLKIQHMSRVKLSENLARRERQVMNILFRRGTATVAEILADLPDPPTYSAVRSILRVLGQKGLITHHEQGPRYLYRPRVDSEQAAEEALMGVVRTFFDGSPEAAVTALLRHSDTRIDKETVRALQQRIQAARAGGR
jgi:predicted transcriptional regulator